MLSLPLIPPQDDQSTWMRNYQRPRSPSPPPSAGQNPQQTHRQRQQRDDEKKRFNARSSLAKLASDEAAIAQRKAAIRNFGAYWIRPPGVPKTLQAMTEEEAERIEQAELERQERGLMDMQAQQQLEEARQRAEQAAAQEQAGEGEEEERNLDDDIPEADAANDTTEVTFNEESMMEGSHLEEAENEEGEAGLLDEDDDEHYAEMEEAELTGAARDEEDLGLEHERDLDDSIPEAGSYQHTDSELDDTDSESELNTSFATGAGVGTRGGGASEPSSRSRRTTANNTPHTRPTLNFHALPGLHERMRAQVGAADALARSPGSLDLSSSILDSSLVESSPVIQRSNHPTRGRGRRG